jgi:hypothetical protein
VDETRLAEIENTVSWLRCDYGMGPIADVIEELVEEIRRLQAELTIAQDDYRRLQLTISERY